MKVFFYSCPNFIQSRWISMLGLNLLLLIFLSITLWKCIDVLKKKEDIHKKTLVLFQVPLILLTGMSFCYPPINQESFDMIKKGKNIKKSSLSSSQKILLEEKIRERKTWFAYSEKDHLMKYKSCKYICDSFLVDAFTMLVCVSQVLMIIILNLKSRQKFIRAFLIYYMVITGLFMIVALLKLISSIFLLLHPYKSLYKISNKNLKRLIDIEHFKEYTKNN